MLQETLEELGITDDMLEDYRESFKMFDADGDNCVSKDELRIAMRNLGHNPTEAELDDIMSTVDTNSMIRLLCFYLFEIVLEQISSTS